MNATNDEIGIVLVLRLCRSDSNKTVDRRKMIGKDTISYRFDPIAMVVGIVLDATNQFFENGKR